MRRTLPVLACAVLACAVPLAACGQGGNETTLETTGTTRFDSYILGTFRFYWFDPSMMCIMGSDSSTVCIHVAPEHAWQQPNRMRGVGKLSP